MKYLFIDTATATLTVAIIIKEKIKYIYNKNIGNHTSTTILPIIDEAFKSTSLKPQEIDKIFVVNGPGSFTGIRVGLTVAKTMAWALKIPVVPISSLEVIASSTPDKINIALIDARRNHVYAGIYDQNLNIIQKDKYMPLNEVEKKGTWISYDQIAKTKPNINIEKIIQKHKNDKGINPHTLNPKYLKKTEAEEKMEKHE